MLPLHHRDILKVDTLGIEPSSLVFQQLSNKTFKSFVTTTNYLPVKNALISSRL